MKYVGINVMWIIVIVMLIFGVLVGMMVVNNVMGEVE